MSDWDESIRQQRGDLYKKLTPDEMLCELLALIHGDGGHHTDKVGLVDSCLDAEDRIEESAKKIDSLQYKLDQLKPSNLLK